MTEPPNLTARLEAMRDALLGAPSPNSLSDVHAAVAAILGPVGAQVSLNDLLINLTRDGLADLKSLEDALIAATAATVALRGVNNATLSALLTESQFDSWGALANGHLVDIKTCVCETRALMRALVMGGLFDELLEDDTNSTGSQLVEGRRYAVWGAVPAGLTSPDPITLEATNWEGWSMLIQTTDPAPWISGAAVAPGSWIELTGTGERNASVLPQYPIAAYVRAPGVPTEPTIISTGTNQGTYTDPNLPGAFIFAYVEVPTWADRVRITSVTTNCFGGIQWRDASHTFINGTYVAGGCKTDFLSDRPGGGVYFLLDGNQTDLGTWTIEGIPIGYVLP